MSDIKSVEVSQSCGKPTKSRKCHTTLIRVHIWDFREYNTQRVSRWLETPSIEVTCLAAAPNRAEFGLMTPDTDCASGSAAVRGFRHRPIAAGPLRATQRFAVGDTNVREGMTA